MQRGAQHSLKTTLIIEKIIEIILVIRGKPEWARAGGIIAPLILFISSNQASWRIHNFTYNSVTDNSVTDNFDSFRRSNSIGSMTAPHKVSRER